MQDAKQRQFDVVLTESPSRLSRDIGDLHRVWKHLEFQGAQLVTLQQGPLDDTALAVHGLIGGEFIKGLRAVVRRGMKGRVREGKVPGGRVYGYRTIPGRPGEREIVPEETKIVQRIFREYAIGESPREIARRLRDEGFPSPGKGGWTRQAIFAGRSSIGGGILVHEIYRGRLVYGKTVKTRNPETGKCVNRPSGEEPVTIEVPHPRIVDDSTWNAVQAVMNGRSRKPDSPRPPWSKNTGLFAGLWRCPCGAHMIVASAAGTKCHESNAPQPTSGMPASIPRATISQGWNGPCWTP